MEARRRSSLRRKPLSDCTNTIAATRRNTSSSAAKSAAVLVKPPKSSNSAVAVTTTNKLKPTATATATSSSLKSRTSTGSNISPNDPSVPSDPPAPPTPLYDSDVRERRKSGLPASQSQRQDENTRKDKGKMILETPVTRASKPYTPRTLELSSSAASGNCPRSGPPAFSSKTLEAQTMKDKGKMVLEASNIKESGPITPHAAVLISATSTSGNHNQERLDFLTVYNQRKYPRRREDADGENVLPLSCPPGKRPKKKGVQPDDDGDGKHSGSRTDPVPLHKKKQSRNKRDDNLHAMPQDDMERLKSYFADIDAFELPEEVASESDLD